MALRTIAEGNPALAETFRTEADYYHRNALRMCYPKFRRLHLFVGSGVIESGCKTVIGSRLKGSGMFWTVRGANNIAARLVLRPAADCSGIWPVCALTPSKWSASPNG